MHTAKSLKKIKNHIVFSYKENFEKKNICFSMDLDFNN